MMRIGQWTIEFDPPPIPLRQFDYAFSHDDYDGADGGNGLAGRAASVQDALDQISEIEGFTPSFDLGCAA